MNAFAEARLHLAIAALEGAFDRLRADEVAQTRDALMEVYGELVAVRQLCELERTISDTVPSHLRLVKP